MPGNTIIINNSKELEWYVGDSKMDETITFLDEVGIRKENSPTDNQICSHVIFSDKELQ